MNRQILRQFCHQSIGSTWRRCMVKEIPQKKLQGHSQPKIQWNSDVQNMKQANTKIPYAVRFTLFFVHCDDVQFAKLNQITQYILNPYFYSCRVSTSCMTLGPKWPKTIVSSKMQHHHFKGDFLFKLQKCFGSAKTFGGYDVPYNCINSAENLILLSCDPCWLFQYSDPQNRKT